MYMLDQNVSLSMTFSDLEKWHIMPPIFPPNLCKFVPFDQQGANSARINYVASVLRSMPQLII